MTSAIIDTHQHLWDLDRFRLPWLEGLDALDRNFTLDDYAAATDGLGVVGSVYMEVDVASDQRRDEVDYVCALCADTANPLVGAIVSGRPGDSGFADWVRYLETRPAVKGVRQVLHVPDAAPGTCLQSNYINSIRLLGEAGLRFDVCMRSSELGDAEKLAAACPDTLLVLDHCGNIDPNVVAGTAEPEGGPSHDTAHWRRAIAALGEYADVQPVFMEEAPFIADCFTATEVPHIVMVPFFIADGLHAVEDIPLLLGEPEARVKKRLAAGQPTWRNPTERKGKLLWYTEAIGSEPGLVEVILERADEGKSQ